jgi:hypothetical protein
MSRIVRAGAAVVWLAVTLPVPLALAQAPSVAGDDGGVDRRVIEGTILFPSDVFPDDPFIAVRTPAGLVAAAPQPARAATETGGLGGAWSGHWIDERDGRQRPAELIITGGLDGSRVVGQLTLLGGARTWTARYEGAITDGVVRFPLPAGGALVVRRADADHLTGEFTAPGGPLPAPAGTLDLNRVR